MELKNTIDWDAISQDEARLDKVLDQVAAWVVAMARNHIRKGNPVPDAIDAAFENISYALKARGAPDEAMALMLDPFLPAKEYLVGALSERALPDRLPLEEPGPLLILMEGGKSS